MIPADTVRDAPGPSIPRTCVYRTEGDGKEVGLPDAPAAADRGSG